jgi:hypothetical protein
MLTTQALDSSSLGSDSAGDSASDSMSVSEGELTADADVIPRQPSRRRTDVMAESFGLPGIFFRRLVWFNAPLWLFNIILVLRLHECPEKAFQLDPLPCMPGAAAVDWLCGRKSILYGMQDLHYSGAGYDLEHSLQAQNICHPRCSSQQYLGPSGHRIAVSIILELSASLG